MSKYLLSVGIACLVFELISAQAVTGGATSVPGVCLCAATGQCSLAGGGAPNDGSGMLDARILGNGVTSGPTGTQNTSTGVGILGTGINWIANNQATCDPTLGLDRCCPPSGYTCGIRYPPVANSPTPAATQVQYGAYPWQCAILTPSNLYLGSAFIIDEYHALTAAHKVYNLTAGTVVKLRCGDWDITGGTEPLPNQEYTVAEIMIHPNFTVANLKQNVAILTTTNMIPFGQIPTIGNICIPNITVSNMRCWVAGWGRATADASTGLLTTIMREVDLPVVDWATCQTQLRTTKLGPNFMLDTQFLCAGGEAGKDSCIGDGGAPLSCFIGDRWYVVGITAWGIGCGVANVPGVYVNIQAFYPWISGYIRTQNRIANQIVTTTVRSG